MIQLTKSKFHIGVFGDSIGKGIVLPPNSTRYRTFKLEVHKLVGMHEQDLNIDNYCMMGSTITKGLSILERHTSKIKQYKNVFLEFGGNDCDYNWSAISEQPTLDHHCNTPIDQFLVQYEKMIQLIRASGGNPIMLTLPPLSADRYFNWISRKLNKDHILRWLGGDVNLIYRWQELYNAQVSMLASRLSVPLIDIRSAFLIQPKYDQFICEDGIHPNERGYELIYKTITSQYKQLLLPNT